jgi:DNA-directed RNA polymerase sigma subunit (sigma70/sigma32)
MTISPNRRNKRQNSLSNVPPSQRNPYLVEGFLECSEEKASLLTKTAKAKDLQAPPPTDSSQTSVTSSISGSRSSTMPGFMDRANTNRQRAYREGIRMMELQSGRKFKETAKDKKKRQAKNGEYMYKTSASVPDSMVNFAYEIHDVDRITPSEEVILGEKTQEAIKLQKIYERLVNKLEREPTDAEWCAAAGKINMKSIVQTIDEGLEAKNKLVTANLRMVQGVVNVYIRNGLQANYNAGDLMQEGIMVSHTEGVFSPCMNSCIFFSSCVIRAAVRRK